jgi:hypothetical protein
MRTGRFRNRRDPGWSKTPSEAKRPPFRARAPRRSRPLPHRSRHGVGAAKMASPRSTTSIMCRRVSRAVEEQQLIEPAGVAVALSSTSIPADGSAAITLAVSPLTVAGNYTLLVTGISGSLTSIVPILLSIVDEPGFSVSTTPQRSALLKANPAQPSSLPTLRAPQTPC